MKFLGSLREFESSLHFTSLELNRNDYRETKAGELLRYCDPMMLRWGLGFQVFLNLNELASESAWLLVFGGFRVWDVFICVVFGG